MTIWLDCAAPEDQPGAPTVVDPRRYLREWGKRLPCKKRHFRSQRGGRGL